MSDKTLGDSGLSRTPESPMFQGVPPAWALTRPKSLLQSLYDLAGAPLRMVLLPDHISERFHLTSLRAERLGVVLKEIKGRCLDIGAGDNMLVRLHKARSVGTSEADAAMQSAGLDVFDWGAGCVVVENCCSLPFEDCVFDTVSFVACLNHIPERDQALREAHRILRPGGKLVITMIGRYVGTIGHALWWYSEDKHREEQHGEVMGMNVSDVIELVRRAGFPNVQRRGFVYNLNSLITAHRS